MPSPWQTTTDRPDGGVWVQSLPSDLCDADRWLGDRGTSAHLSLQAAVLLGWNPVAGAEILAEWQFVGIYQLIGAVADLAAISECDRAGGDRLSTLL